MAPPLILLAARGHWPATVAPLADGLLQLIETSGGESLAGEQIFYSSQVRFLIKSARLAAAFVSSEPQSDGSNLLHRLLWSRLGIHS